MKTMRTMAFALAAALIFTPFNLKANDDVEEFKEEMKEEKGKYYDLKIQHHKDMASQLEKVKKACMSDDKEACKKAHEDAKGLREEHKKKYKEMKAKRKEMRGEMKEKMKEKREERKEERKEKREGKGKGKE